MLRVLSTWASGCQNPGFSRRQLQVEIRLDGEPESRSRQVLLWLQSFLISLFLPPGKIRLYLYLSFERKWSF